MIARSRSTSVGAHWRGRSSGIPVEEEVMGDDIGVLIATNDVVGSEATRTNYVAIGSSAAPHVYKRTADAPEPQEGGTTTPAS